MSSYGYYNTLRRKNPYGSLGPSPQLAARVNRGLGRGATGAPPPPPPPYDPFRDATASVDALLAGWLDQIRAEQQAAREQAQREAALELSKGQALAQGLQQLGISNAIQSIFQNAGSSQAALAQGFSGQMQQQAAQQAAEQQRMLSGTGQEAAVRDQGVNMGNVQYGLGGFIPASTLNTQAANFAAEAALQPGFAQQFGQLAERQRMNQFVTDELPRFSQAIQDVLAKKPGLYRDALDEAWDLANKPATAAKTTLRTLANGQVGVFQNGKLVRTEGPAKADGAAATPKLQARTLANGQVQWFDPTTGRPVGGPQGPARKTTAKDPATGRDHNLQLKTVGDRAAWFDPRTGKRVGGWLASPSAAPKGRPDGMTPTQVRKARTTAYNAALAWNEGFVDADGTEHKPREIKASEFLKTLINQDGIPFDIAVRQLAKVYPPAENWYADRSAANAGTAADRQLVETAMDLGPRSGTRYVFGGASPAGFDCSGYTMTMVERETGIRLPHNAAAQFNDPRGVPVSRSELRPGDVVFFTSNPNRGGSGPPWHCGYYIGNGRYVEYYRSGAPARVSSLSSRKDYMGARRFGGR